MIFTALSFLSLIYGLFFVWVGNVSQTICFREGVINVTLNMIFHWEHYQQQLKYRNMIEKIWHIPRSIRKKCLKSVKKKYWSKIQEWCSVVFLLGLNWLLLYEQSKILSSNIYGLCTAGIFLLYFQKQSPGGIAISSWI